MTTAKEYIQSTFETVKARNGHEAEFLQAVEEFLSTLEPVFEKHPEYIEENILARITEPERVISFRVPWVDRDGKVQVNRGYRVQFNSAVGPYKGGLRFHPTVNQGILKFLGFEQIFKNVLTGLPIGGGKGGSDFDPKGKTDAEVMRFCQALMAELYRHVGPDTDVPAGDIGVGGREVGYLAGYMKKLSNQAACVFTGRGLSFGGSLIRPEATGYGLVYFAQAMLAEKGDSFQGKTVLVSGSGNVAQYAIEKAMALGAKVVTCSDSAGYVYLPEGFDREKLEALLELKNVKRGRVEEFAKQFGLQYFAGKRPWEVKADIALPCATQNELEISDAKALIANGVKLVAEGANMPTTIEATEAFLEAGVLFGPGKAANAGGVATSGLEMAQSSQRLYWTAEEVDKQLHRIMLDIHANCKKYGSAEGQANINYVVGANVAGFVKVADAMLAQGVY